MPVGGRQDRRGFTLIELLMVVAIIGILLATTVPSLLRARMSSNESSAIASLRAVYSGQQAFWSSCGLSHYSPSLQNLGTPVGTSPGFVSPDLAGAAPVLKSGYIVEVGTDAPVGLTSCNGGTVALTYHATAEPNGAGGVRHFGTNGGGTIYESTNALVGAMPDQGAPGAPAHPLETR